MVKDLKRWCSAMSIVPGWNDLVDIGRTAITGGKNFYNQLNGDRPEKSPLAHKDQYVPRTKAPEEFPDIGNIHHGAEDQAAKYKLDDAL